MAYQKVDKLAVDDYILDLSDYYDKSETDNLLDNKQNKLNAGSNVQISGNTISATDTKYTAGSNVQINGTTISATDTKYTAGTNVTITNNQISVPDSAFANKMKVLNINVTRTGTIANDTQTDITYANSYKFDRGGIFIGAIQVQMAANASGGRFVGALKYNADGSVNSTNGNQRNAPPPTGQWMGTAPVMLWVEKNQAVGARMYQNSGASLAYTAYIAGKLFYNFTE